ncbi:MAG: hypothetical protein FJ087_23095, partial [Deltaproteobacteria bacterium]|nr:hypothetical protein [Deltaproteobacteria bacterium]
MCCSCSLGRDAADLLIDWATEVESRQGILVEFSRFRNLDTVMDPRGLPLLGSQPYLAKGVDFHDRRTAMSGDVREEYRYADTRPPRDGLRFIDVVGDSGTERVVLVGNRLAADAVSLPFAQPGIDALLAGRGRIGKPFGVHTAWAPDGEEEVAFVFDGDLPAPAFVAWSDGEVAWAAGGTGAVCPAGQDTELWAMAGGYDLSSWGAAGCTFDFEALPAHVARGAPLGAVLASGETPPAWRTGFRTGTGFFMPFCPYWALSSDAREHLVAAASTSSYREQLTEPFLCNPPARAASAFPMTREWRRRTRVNPVANPATVV